MNDSSRDKRHISLILQPFDLAKGAAPVKPKEKSIIRSTGRTKARLRLLVSNPTKIPHLSLQLYILKTL
jgi:hypothetical protein